MMLKNHLIKSMDILEDTFKLSTNKILLLVGEKSDFDHHRLSSFEGEVYGAIFPQLIHEKNNYADAILVIELDNAVEVMLSSFDSFNFSQIDDSATDIVVFVDGLSAGITDFLEELYSSTSTSTNIIGAGAGEMTLVQKPVLFDKAQ